MARGQVKWFDDDNGFGFITGDDGDEFFVHYTSVDTDGLKSLAEGQPVEFDIEVSPKGGQAVNVRPTGQSTTAP